MDHFCPSGLLGPRLPPTPESATDPTFLPHVRAPLPSLLAAPEAGDVIGGNHVGALEHAQERNQEYGSPEVGDPVKESPMSAGLNVLLHSRDALANLHHLYATSAPAQHAFAQAVAVMASTVRAGGRVIVTGMGKSGKIGEKLVATWNSLGVRAMYIHAADAVHGDLGGIARNDAMLLITNSARTPELVAMVPHLPPSMPLMVMTAAIPALPCSISPPFKLMSTSVSMSKPSERSQSGSNRALAAYPLFAYRSDEAHFNLIIPAPIPVSEAAAFGVPAPTTSTTVALALGDALAIATAEHLHGTTKMAEVFRKGHPGGWIGKNL